MESYKPYRLASNEENDNLLGYPMYPESEDIYSKYHEEKDIDPEDIFERKEVNENNLIVSLISLGFNHPGSGRDLDIPGSEMDDDQENIGNEDEENNYYSLGGDDNSNLDEN